MELKFDEKVKIFFVSVSGKAEDSSELMLLSYVKMVQLFKTTENVQFVSAEILSSQMQTNSVTNVYVVEDSAIFVNFVAAKAIVIGPGTISNSQLHIDTKDAETTTNCSITQEMCLSGNGSQKVAEVHNPTIKKTLNDATVGDGNVHEIDAIKVLTGEVSMIGLNIDTGERLTPFIELLFEKAVDERHSVTFAQLCHKLCERSLSANADAERAIFKKTLIRKCQNEFQNHVLVDEAKVIEKLLPPLQKIEETTDINRKAEYQAIYKVEEQKMRRRSVGTVRFIGELFKMGMLAPNTMMNCLTRLLDRNSENRLECLCKLLTTIGGHLEYNYSIFAKLNDCFQQMKEIVDGKNQSTTISSRVMFMIQDVIDLRKNNWCPRRQTEAEEEW